MTGGAWNIIFTSFFETGKTEEEVSCVVGLAALDQPVLNQVKTMLEEGTGR